MQFNKFLWLKTFFGVFLRSITFIVVESLKIYKKIFSGRKVPQKIKKQKSGNLMNHNVACIRGCPTKNNFIVWLPGKFNKNAIREKIVLTKHSKYFSMRSAPHIYRRILQRTIEKMCETKKIRKKWLGN